MKMITKAVTAVALCLFGATQSTADAGAEDLAKQLANPIASLISVPLEVSYDEGYGATGDGSQTIFFAKPVVPISLNDDWNLISRTIIPFIHQNDIVPGTSDSGMGDIVQSFFFSPKRPTAGGLIWGAGPVIQFPTAKSNAFGVNEWGAGLTAVALKQSGPWTYGGLVNHIWDVGGAANQQSVTFLQPFVSYTTPTSWTFAFQTESTYNHVTEEWNVPLNLRISKLVQFGKQPVSITGGLRYWADSPAGGADGWGLTLGATLLFPK